MQDLFLEYQALDAFIETLSPRDFQLLTPGTERTVFDQISHIAYFDYVSLLAVRKPDLFKTLAAEIGPLFTSQSMDKLVRNRLQISDPNILINRWRSWYEPLATELTKMPPDQRLPWFGPTMSVKSFATARLAQTWAHGQDIYDALGQQRAATIRLKHVAHLGILTYSWSFTNRGMKVPNAKVSVHLEAPDKTTWSWGDLQSSEQITGTAEEFCLVVTQRRNIADTALKFQGQAAVSWMDNAQCFAGPPLIGPQPGIRLKNSLFK